MFRAVNLCDATTQRCVFLFIKAVVNIFKSKLEMRFVCGLVLFPDERRLLRSNASCWSVVVPH